MQISASNIASSEGKCPSCGEQASEGDAACLSCGYGFEFAASMLPYEAPPLRKFIDFEGHLAREDIKDGQRALEKLRARFPQVTLCTCVVEVPDGVSVTEFGFWLFNQSVPNGPRMVERRLHSILFTIDPKRKEAALTVGYGLDPFVDDEALTRCLEAVHKPLAVGHYGRAIRRLCAALRPALDHGLRQAQAAMAAEIAEWKRQQHEDRMSGRPAVAPARARHSIIETHDSHV